jgi:hypothetical protein
LIRENGLESADIEEANMLATQTFRIIREIKGSCSDETEWCIVALLSIKSQKKKFSEEIKGSTEGFLSDAIRYQGVDGRITGHPNLHLGLFHLNIVKTLPSKAKINHLQLSDSYQKKTLRTFLNHYGPYFGSQVILINDFAVFISVTM